MWRSRPKRSSTLSICRPRPLDRGARVSPQVSELAMVHDRDTTRAPAGTARRRRPRTDRVEPRGPDRGSTCDVRIHEAAGGGDRGRCRSRGRHVVVLTAGARPMGGRALPEGAWAVGGSAAWRSGRCGPCPAFRPANGNRATGRGRSPLRYDRCEALTDELTLSSNPRPRALAAGPGGRAGAYRLATAVVGTQLT